MGYTCRFSHAARLERVAPRRFAARCTCWWTPRETTKSKAQQAADVHMNNVTLHNGHDVSHDLGADDGAGGFWFIPYCEACAADVPSSADCLECHTP